MMPQESRPLAQISRTTTQYSVNGQMGSQSLAGSSKARRVTIEERLRQEQEIAEEEKRGKSII